MMKWLRQNSLYFLLIGCVMTVGLAAWVLGGEEEPPTETEVPPKAPTVEVAAPPIETAPVTVTMPPIVEEAPPAETITVKAPTPKPVSYLRPVGGEVLREYAVDRLLYSETMSDWRTHDGVDFAATVGTPVQAVADGTVTEVVYDRLKGVTVAVRQDDGYTAVYANLAELDAIAEGTVVSQGETVGTVGETALLELADPPHLHFELRQEDKPVDPFEKLPQ